MKGWRGEVGGGRVIHLTTARSCGTPARSAPVVYGPAGTSVVCCCLLLLSTGDILSAACASVPIPHTETDSATTPAVNRLQFTYNKASDTFNYK